MCRASGPRNKKGGSREPPSDRQRATRLERATTSLEGGLSRTQAAQSQQLMSDPEAACTSACTNSEDSGHSEAADGPNPAPAGDAFAEAVKMLARLPLSDAERAEAVRRLLAQRPAPYCP